MIYNFSIRKSWDKALPKLKVIETVDENTDYIYSMFKVFCFGLKKIRPLGGFRIEIFASAGFGRGISKG